jgi:hypothetical protein
MSFMIFTHRIPYYSGDQTREDEMERHVTCMREQGNALHGSRI